MSLDPINTHNSRWLKRSVCYKITNGMKALGNQCQNCKHVKVQINHCTLMNFWVSARGHCDKFERKES